MRLFLFLLFISVSCKVSGQFSQPDTLSVLQPPVSYDVLQHQRRAMGVLTGWSVLSVSTGAVQLLNANPRISGFGVQNLVWGLIDGAISGYALYDLKQRSKKGTIDIQFEREHFRKVLLINTLLDVLYIGTGAALLYYGNPQWKGHGMGIVVQGSFLFLFDGINYGLTF